MEIREKKVDDIVLLSLEGRLDATSAKDLKKKVGTLTQEKRLRIILDMSEINFIDSSGLGSLVASLRSVNKLGGDIKIATIQDPVRVIFELTRLHHIFEIFDDKESAIESFK